ncbi:hypothetical protein AAFN90_00655 [Erwiniaceae bacterium CAU 1747]
MFIKLTVTHTIVSGAGFHKNSSAHEELVNFEYVVKMIRGTDRNFTRIEMSDGSSFGVSETPEDITKQLK